MYCYPWDLAGVELKPRFQLLRELGVSTLQLAVSYHAATFLMPNQPARLVFGAEPGAIYFEPSGRLFSGQGEITPHVAGTRFDLEELVESAAAAGLETTAWTVFCYNHSLAAVYPEHAVKSPFSEPHIAQLCPNSGATRDYFERLVAELTDNYRFKGIVFESLSFLPFNYGWINPKESVVMPAELSRLLSTCFCDSCLAIGARHGLDGARIRAQVQAVCRRELNRLPLPEGSAVSLSGLDVPAFERYRSSNRADLNLFHQELLEHVRAAGLAVDSTATYDSPPPEVTGIEHSSLRHVVDSSRIAIRPDMTSDEVRSILNEKQAAFPSSRIDVLLEPGDFGSRDSFLCTLAACRSAGARNYRFYSLSTITEEQLDWLEAGKEYWSGPRT